VGGRVDGIDKGETGSIASPVIELDADAVVNTDMDGGRDDELMNCSGWLSGVGVGGLIWRGGIGDEVAVAVAVGAGMVSRSINIAARLFGESAVCLTDSGDLVGFPSRGSVRFDSSLRVST
jgi:hypothetical protein